MNYNDEMKQDTSSASRLQDFKKLKPYKYLLSILIIVSMTILQKLIWDFVAPAPFLLFYPGVLLGIMYGDGITAIILSCISIQYFFVEPYGQMKVHWPEDYVRMAIFILVAFIFRKIIRSRTLEKLRAQTALELLQKREVDLEEEKATREKFVSTLTHDLRTPLTAAKLNIHLMERKKTDPEFLAEAFGKQSHHLNRIDQMIQNLLDANSIRAGKTLPLEIKFCDLQKIIENAVHDLETIYGKRFEIKNIHNVEGYWSCDGIRRILENLSSNAVKYGAEDKPVVISGEATNTGILISVNNQGRPLSQDEVSNLFKPYHRSSSAIRSHVQGWGLGLSLVKALTEAQGGTVQVESNESQGTTFTCYLPMDARPFIK